MPGVLILELSGIEITESRVEPSRIVDADEAGDAFGDVGERLETIGYTPSTFSVFMKLSALALS